MPYCRECGGEIGSEDQFCADCGASVETPGDTTEESRDERQSAAGSGDAAASADGTSPTDDVDWKQVGVATVLAFIPAVFAYIIVSVAVGGDALVWVLPVAWAVLGYLLYRRPTAKAALGGMFFWLSIEVFLTPLALTVSTFVFTSQEAQTAAEEVGAVLGGLLVVGGAFVVGIPVAIAFYLLSVRLDEKSD